jgi:hypothetical protein
VSTSEQSIKKLLDEERTKLENDAELLAQLSVSRQQALKAVSSISISTKSHLSWWQTWRLKSKPGAWGGSIAVCFALVVFVYVVSASDSQMLDPEWLDLDVELAMSLDDLEEDVEFYYWMENGNT